MSKGSTHEQWLARSRSVPRSSSRARLFGPDGGLCGPGTELRRNAATRSGGLAYRATTAQWHAERSARRPKQTKLVLNAALRIFVAVALAAATTAFANPINASNPDWRISRQFARDCPPGLKFAADACVSECPAAMRTMDVCASSGTSAARRSCDGSSHRPADAEIDRPLSWRVRRRWLRLSFGALSQQCGGRPQRMARSLQRGETFVVAFS
jgi:hypothetical protein